MLKKMMLLIVAGASLAVVSGCVSTRTYVVNKPRVDQDMPGQPKDAPVKTRKMIVMEVIENDKVQPAAHFVGNQAAGQAVSQENNFTLPQGAVQEPKAVVPSVEPQKYVVQKDDTLQKISKKVYGSYSKWTRIYDANRTVIKDPNFLKPGITLEIPVLETVAPTIPKDQKE